MRRNKLNTHSLSLKKYKSFSGLSISSHLKSGILRLKILQRRSRGIQPTVESQDTVGGAGHLHDLLVLDVAVDLLGPGLVVVVLEPGLAVSAPATGEQRTALRAKNAETRLSYRVGKLNDITACLPVNQGRA